MKFLVVVLTVLTVFCASSVMAQTGDEDVSRITELSLREKPTRVHRGECVVTVIRVIHRVMREMDTRYHIFRPVVNCTYRSPSQIEVRYRGGLKTIQNISGIVEEIIINP